MKRTLTYVLAGLLILAASCSFTNKTFDNPEKDKLLVEIITYVLERGHFDPKDVDNDFSENVFDDYVNSIDPLKRLFLESDIKEFEAFRHEIDDQIRNREVAFFNLTYNRLMQRLEEARSIYKAVLEKPFNYNTEETYNTDYELHNWASSKKELRERWRQQLKYVTISGFDRRLKENAILEEKIAEGAELSDYEEDETPKATEQIEAEARESTLKTLEDFFEFNNDLDRSDWFSVYINRIVEEFDPHTFYFAPDEKDRFDTSISGKFEGIGARLQKRDNIIKIIEVISGGPVWRGKQVEVGDVILKVAQGEEEPVDIIGMRLTDAVKLIKGAKGTEVRLTIKKVDGSQEVVSITRDVVEIEESYAKTAMVKKNNHSYGIINLPKFYIDFKDRSQRNAASDVAKEIERLKDESMDGLVIDLRNNGGGSLKTVVDMAGLFIKEGPIVQVKTVGEQKEVLADNDPNIQWDGPLVILVNELSASASEILAAAMQDYERAIIIGSKQTYGKGTVQNIYDLNRFVRGSEFGDIGALKVTTQKFYRIDGESTQLEGVKSDVVVADRYSYIDIGEKDQENPLPWDRIDPAGYITWNGYLPYKETVENSNKRMADNEQLELIKENALWIHQQRELHDFSLNYDEYKKKVDEDEKKLDYFDAIEDYKTNLTFTSLPYELKLISKDTLLRDKRIAWHEELSGDVYVEEAINVLQDIQLGNLKKNKVAIKQ